MAVTEFKPGLHATYSTTNGGNIPDAHVLERFVNWAQALDNGIGRTPLLDAIGFGEELDQRRVYFGQSYSLEIDSQLGADTAASGTTITLASGHGKRYKKFDVLGIFETASDLSPAEIVIVDSINGDALTVKRAQAGTTAGVVAASGAVVRLIGSSEPQNDFHVLSPTIRGDFLYNDFQRFVEGAGADKAYQNTPTREYSDNPMLRDYEIATRRGKKSLERALWYGKRQQETASTPNGLMAGFQEFIVSNDFDMAGAALSHRTLEGYMLDMLNEVDDSMAKTWVMSHNTLRLVSATLNPVRRATMQDTTLGGSVTKLQTGYGAEFDLKPFKDCPDGVIYLLDFSEMKVHPFKGLNWHPSDKEGRIHGADHDEKYVSGDFTLVIENERTMAKIHGFDVDIANYPELGATTP